MLWRRWLAVAALSAALILLLIRDRDRIRVEQMASLMSFSGARPLATERVRANATMARQPGNVELATVSFTGPETAAEQAAEPPPLLSARAYVLSAACELRNLGINSLLKRDSRFYASQIQIASSGSGVQTSLTALIRSPSCPPDTHTYVSASRSDADSAWHIDQLLDCQTANRGEIYRAFRVQGQLTYVGEVTDPNVKDLGISGSGDFLLLCPQGYVATRDGHFTRDREGFWRSDEGCQVLDINLQPVTELDDMVATVDLHASPVVASELIGPGRLAVSFEKGWEPAIMTDPDKIIEGYRETCPTCGGSGVPDELFQAMDLETECDETAE